jgi:hypothetical protein
MSDIILQGLNRKTGKWDVLCDSTLNYDEHYRVYSAISSKQPVNNDYSKVRFCRLQSIHTPLSLITEEENKKRLEGLEQNAERAKTSGIESEARQKALDEAETEKHTKAHANALDEKNALVNDLRRATGQEPVSETQTEKNRSELAESLKGQDPKRLSDSLARLRKQLGDEDASRLEGLSKKTGKSIQEIQAEEKAREVPAVPKTKEEELAEKNALVDKTKQQSQEHLQQQEQTAADKSARVENLKNKSAKI